MDRNPVEQASPFLDKVRQILGEIVGDGKWLSREDEAALRERLEKEVREGRMQPEQVEKTLKWVRLVGGISPDLSSGIAHEVLKAQSPAVPELRNEPLQPSTAGGKQAFIWLLLAGLAAFLYYYLAGR